MIQPRSTPNMAGPLHPPKVKGVGFTLVERCSYSTDTTPILLFAVEIEAAPASSEGGGMGIVHQGVNKIFADFPFPMLMHSVQPTELTDAVRREAECSPRG
jgi:hypothetical protein